MISAEKRIGVNIQVLTKTAEEQNAIVDQIRQDFISVVHHYMEDYNSDDVKIILIADATCGNCGKLVPHCTCGKPNRSPLV
jgi:capsular polysaccharide biosynthesis protein